MSYDQTFEYLERKYVPHNLDYITKMSRNINENIN